MQVAENTVVSFDYTLRDEEGTVLDSSEGREPLAYLHGHGNIVPGLEKAMAGHSAGDEFQVTVDPEEGYGPYREELIQNVPRDAFEGVENLEPGMSFQAQSSAGPLIVTVKEIEGDEITVDGNHALAGQPLDFSVAVTEVREATPEEQENGEIAG